MQVLFGFMLNLAFTQRFTEISDVQRGVYLFTLCTSAASAAFLIAPASYHRLVFRRRLKHQLVRRAHRCGIAGLALLMLAICGAIHLAASVVIGSWGGLVAGVTAAFVAGLWFVLPVIERARHSHLP